MGGLERLLFTDLGQTRKRNTGLLFEDATTFTTFTAHTIVHETSNYIEKCVCQINCFSSDKKNCDTTDKISRREVYSNKLTYYNFCCYRAQRVITYEPMQTNQITIKKINFFPVIIAGVERGTCKTSAGI